MYTSLISNQTLQTVHSRAHSFRNTGETVSTTQQESGVHVRFTTAEEKGITAYHSGMESDGRLLPVLFAREGYMYM